MTELRVAHTADLDARTRHALRELLDLTFDGEFTDEDFSHSLGGMHALLHAEGTLIGHASVVQRQLLHGDRVLRTGYVEGVAVHPGHQRQGHGGRLMAPLERIIREGYELGALGAAQDAQRLYRGRGWLPWLGPTFALTPAGIVRTPAEDDAVHVLPVGPALDRTSGLTCDWRVGDVW
ncbi:GNAT family N-acetyltransferase [Crossiella cryophila]|uniref:Aminoglycoside 2'-N-acetyltransferase I n=1 Tax=Crossiella cryophila TaxID=43355 RepID=A0A7W7FUB0_9PSEU|nr:GNAT family N-acetyltransferase [Crossiella cryophila]MBB4679101.1 aminoglycoside 2'-N-acetyltransferase I [Crossiella cryophila]